jgi:inner membrane protein
MNRALFWKSAALAGLGLALLILLLIMGGLVQERQARRDEAVAEMARASGGPQQLLGPILVLPIAFEEETWTPDKATGANRRRVQQVTELRYVMPQTLELAATLGTQERSRGLYTLRSWEGRQHLKARFAGVQQALPQGDPRAWRLLTPYVAVSVSDVRGIGTDLKVGIAGQAAIAAPGSELRFAPDGVHAPLPATVPLAGLDTLDVQVELPLRGSSGWSVVPVGRENRIRLDGDWPHPSFGGDFLPSTREVGADGFTAQWDTSHFATQFEALLRDCERRAAECKELKAPVQSVSFIDPVDTYLKTDRAMKYAILFLALTFAALFITEVMVGRPIHAVQYALVGKSLAVFFLLLLSLSEHIGFGLAYLVAAVASLLLQGTYLRHVLDSRARGLAFGGGFAVMYGLLYVLLGLEDYALLVGAVFLFVALATVMWVTRRVDWGRFGAPSP